MIKIILAAGCFWSVQYKLNSLEGVIETKAVYAGGEVPEATYQQVCSGTTGHAEGVLVTYNDSVLSTEDLLRFFFLTHDATQLNRQGPDIGEQYRSGVFYFNEEQRMVALKVIEELQQLPKYAGKKITTVVEPVSLYNNAEEYHQEYYKKKGF
ncbi:MAG: peptide-methionine (S)-S-oxide reductase [Bacteroidetes bacterium GWF2_43_63]|nr:MAG: peptide-methionine (S)-S-oxide reductase [Bacteroidetes bacterium GWE2_42_42]OFY55704.1 MAG: peptide-methionine (S)-S-oxide reductase [Bacteroidetes bacterium GWF2_43_63]HBG69489.1 peptide-methionine (S)-S-oxide reductase [Bacteroidales bacterium]HCB61344.1 peptide-methionine (S)-S-oxide reductase [Bacteroidales bacterium]HCY24219.1 peptide-methionine (S)-S-oxide reductase [Bacteroidales bacterium]